MRPAMSMLRVARALPRPAARISVPCMGTARALGTSVVRFSDVRRMAPKSIPSRFPLGGSAPETITFDMPAVPHPHRTANSNAFFCSGARMLMFGCGLVVIVGGTAYVGWNTLSADGPPNSSWFGPESLYADLKRGIAESTATQTAQFMLLSLTRSSTIIKAVVLCVWDYRRVLNTHYDDKAAEDEALRDCHLRCANRLLIALQTNGGLYIKLGQHLSSVILLPPEWTTTLRPLQDQNEPTPLPELEMLFQHETGKSFDEAFAWIDEKPLGVASLAQVHKACDRETGQLLAVKMLHPDVERFSDIDMRMVTILVHWVKRVFPDFAFDWLADEMNKNMPLELDFRHEAGNAMRARSDFAQYRNTSVYFPDVPWVHRRVMAMEFVSGARPDNLGYLAEHNINRNRVSQELSKIFAQMLYIHGFFHADPHGGNLLIRPRPKQSRSSENFEIVLLDHGLYFEIDEELRSNYARFWLSLLSRSTPSVKYERRRLARLVGNIDDDLYPVLESAITGRSGLEGSDHANPNGVKGRPRMSSLLELESGPQVVEDEKEHIRKTVLEKEGLILNVMELLRRVPRVMLMVLKINDLTRSLDANLHTTHGPTRPFIITARYCAIAMHRNDQRKLSERRRSEGLSFRMLEDYLWSWYNYTYFYYGMSLLERVSDIKARVSKYFMYISAMFSGGFNPTAARRAAAGIEEQEREEAKAEADRRRAVRALEGDIRQTDS